MHPGSVDLTSFIFEQIRPNGRVNAKIAWASSERPLPPGRDPTISPLLILNERRAENISCAQLTRLKARL